MGAAQAGPAICARWGRPQSGCLGWAGAWTRVLGSCVASFFLHLLLSPLLLLAPDGGREGTKHMIQLLQKPLCWDANSFPDPRYGALNAIWGWGSLRARMVQGRRSILDFTSEDSVASPQSRGGNWEGFFFHVAPLTSVRGSGEWSCGHPDVTCGSDSAIGKSSLGLLITWAPEWESQGPEPVAWVASRSLLHSDHNEELRRSDLYF